MKFGILFGEVKIKEGILTYSNGAFVTTRIVDETYQLNPAGGDISIEWVWRPQVYESVRIGSRATSIYPYKARPIAYNRNGKLPYNGIAELLPGFGRFSIVDTVIPYQVFRNIVSYHREMAIAKNKMNVLMIAKSLLGKKPAETIYRMAADGVLYIDDEDDANLVKAQNVRYLESRMNNYITELGQLIQEIEQTAKMECDMTPQRYGEIANSAGKGVTDEAVIRGSMGSVIIEFIFDKMRERDYQAEMDYTKLAWIDGLNTSYKTKDGDIRYLSLDVNSHIFANYIVTCKTSVKEREKLEQYKQLAFSAAQMVIWIWLMLLYVEIMLLKLVNLLISIKIFNVSMNLMLNVFLNKQNNFVKNLNLLRLIEKQNKIEKQLELKNILMVRLKL